MHLLSSLAPNGYDQSTGHYILLRHDNQRDLVELPNAYSDLEEVVKKLYRLNPDEFHIETKELNLCDGDRIKIPKGLWKDVALLLGNVYVVSRLESAQSDAQLVVFPVPDSIPAPEYNPIQGLDAFPVPDINPVPDYNLNQSLEASPAPDRNPAPDYNPNQGLVVFEAPLFEEELLVITLGAINFHTDLSSATRFSIRLFDENTQIVLSITFFLRTGSMFLSTPTTDTVITRSLRDFFTRSTDHNIIILKQGAAFQVLFDVQFVVTVGAPTYSILTSLSYDFGSDSPFKGPLSATVYSGVEDFREQIGPYRALFSSLDKEILFLQVLICDHRDATLVSGSLSTVRLERELFKARLSTSGIKCRSQNLTHERWSSFTWDPVQQRHSIYILRFTLPDNSPTPSIFFSFGKAADFALRVGLKADGTVTFSEHDFSLGTRRLWEYHTIKLARSLHTPGEHSIAFVFLGGKLYVNFDFKQSTVLPRNGMVARRPKEVYPSLYPDTVLVADTYEFGV